MGVVYKACDVRLGRLVALKFLLSELTRDPAAKERFALEPRAASTLDHRNIATIFGIDETPEGHVFLAMAYYEGETVDRKIARGPLGVEDAIDIATQVADGLADAHKAGIVHRDIKPANVLITSRGLAKILDFGVAKLTQQTTATTTVGTTAGTLAYMSPEQLGSGAVDGATDVWSLGVVLYEMLAGERPFGGDAVATMTAILNREPTSLSAFRADVPSTVDAIVAYALAKSRSNRIPSAAEFAKALRTHTTARVPAPRRQTRL